MTVERVLLAALSLTLLAALSAAWLVGSLAGGAADVPWYAGMGLIAGVGIVGVVWSARSEARNSPLGALVILATVGTMALAVAHWLFVVSRAFSGLTILVAVLGALCVGLAVRWHRSRSRA